MPNLTQANGMMPGVAPMGASPMDAAPMGGPAQVPDYKAKLQQEMGGLDNMKRDIQAKSAINEQRLQEVKTELIQSLFEMLQSLGVDPSNIDSIRGFLQNLEKQDPDLAEIFSLAFNGLVGDQQDAGQSAPTAPAAQTDGMMNKYNNLAGGMMG